MFDDKVNKGDMSLKTYKKQAEQATAMPPGNVAAWP